MMYPETVKDDPDLRQTDLSPNICHVSSRSILPLLRCMLDAIFL